MTQKIALTTFSQDEILMAADTLNTTVAGKRRIILTAEGFTTIEDRLRQLPNTPGLPPGEIIPGVSGYLYNLPVFIDPHVGGNYMI